MTVPTVWFVVGLIGALAFFGGVLLLILIVAYDLRAHARKDAERRERIRRNVQERERQDRFVQEWEGRLNA